MEEYIKKEKNLVVSSHKKIFSLTVKLSLNSFWGSIYIYYDKITEKTSKRLSLWVKNISDINTTRPMTTRVFSF